MSFVVITGANRGIGLELTKIYSQRGDEVLAVCRQASPELKNLGTAVYEGFEVTSEKSILDFQKYLNPRKIDILIHNAGILVQDNFDQLDFDQVLRQFEINALAPLKITKILSPQLASGAKVALMTSRMGSIADNGSGNYYGYRMSKAALNMAGVNLAKDLRSRGIGVYILHPGMVATEMTGHQGIAPAEAAQNLVQRLDALQLENSGKFWHASGEELPW